MDHTTDNTISQLTGIIPGQINSSECVNTVRSITGDEWSDEQWSQNRDSVIDQSCDRSISSCDDSSGEYEADDLDFRSLEEYRRLAQLFRDYPRGMFVQCVLREYASSESDLDRIRSQYFSHLKEITYNLPFDENAELKRRMASRSGEPVCVRLAQDIHTIIEVTEGGDINALKSMISVGKTRRISVAAKKCSRSTPIYRSAEKCACASELTLIKDSVASLEANFLLFKQTCFANDKLRADQVQSVKCCSEKIKTELIQCGDSISSLTVSTLDSMRNLTMSLVERITEIEDRVRHMEAFLDTNSVVTIARCGSNTNLFQLETTDTHCNNTVFVENDDTEFSDDLNLNDNDVITYENPLELDPVSWPLLPDSMNLDVDTSDDRPVRETIHDVNVMNAIYSTARDVTATDATPSLAHDVNTVSTTAPLTHGVTTTAAVPSSAAHDVTSTAETPYSAYNVTTTAAISTATRDVTVTDSSSQTNFDVTVEEGIPIPVIVTNRTNDQWEVKRTRVSNFCILGLVLTSVREINKSNDFEKQ